MYKIVEAEGLNELEDLVLSAIKMGYTPTGGVTRTPNGYTQAVFMSKKPSNWLKNKSNK